MSDIGNRISQTQGCHRLLGGPSKRHLRRALFNQKGEDFHRVVFIIPTVIVDSHDEWVVRVIGMQVNDDSGESWVIEGYAGLFAHVLASGGRITGFADGVPEDVTPHRRVSIRFRTDDRSGHMTFLD